MLSVLEPLTAGRTGINLFQGFSTKRLPFLDHKALPPQIDREGIDESSNRAYWRDKFSLDWNDFLEDVAQKDSTCVAVYCGNHAGNIGAALRVSALLGISILLVIGGFGNNAISSALRIAQLQRRPEWGVRLVVAPEAMAAKEVLLELQQVDLKLLGLTAHEEDGSVPEIWHTDLRIPKLAFVFGRESDGIPSEAEEILDAKATIPMTVDGSEGSLNVSQAAALVFYERRRQLLMRRASRLEEMRSKASTLGNHLKKGLRRLLKK
eukprot:TRINITY_DN17278_c0_g1_i1.p1 TRINITY_DN17278_c0_g1~~TRINITY_DN17278_c0_g1_i1.p1  ORF type:complete len:265 (+),score=42.73 TRINITY_DN17278_c0_g1_i1:82-876(+)